MPANESVEVWKNTAAGMRWLKVLDRQNREMGKTIPGGRSFTISVFDRQANQDMAAEPSMDLFRNGTFVLVKASDETNEDEIESPESFTDVELAAVVHEIMAKNISAEAAISKISSPVTLGRLLETLVIEDAPSSAIAAVKAKKAEVEPGAAVEREVVVAPKPKPKPKKTEAVVTKPDEPEE